ncbi:DUF3772 domain-containing protein [Sphingomonas jatrophae]|uniref:Small-conductance mechanosensitive channel n=1 Tax=Sphingomonas jatrophae TaxID=1166337 RepID=A0A1I6J9Z9_9SPHN|nr:DUF3772 domain-containing protein [Sphingomonas jatrophae]SFR75774.1 Small-conductance mechanosensitive channel [Sphingomonas jatrophae]
MISCLRAVLLFLLLLPVAHLAAQPAMELTEAAKRLSVAASQIARADRTLEAKTDEPARDALRQQLTAAATDAAAVATGLQAELALVDARIAELGPAAAAETPELRNQRTLLAQQRTGLDSAIKRGRLLGIEAQQLIDEIEAAQAEQIGERIAQRTPSPVSPAFWSRLLKSLPRDLGRGARLLSDIGAEWGRGFRGQVPWPAAAGLAVALLLLFPARLALRRAGRNRMVAQGVPGHRVRRSAYALWRVVVGTALPGFAALIFAQGLRWSDMVSERAAPLLDTLVVAAFVSAFVNSLAGTLLLRSQPSWRLLSIDDATAQRLRPWSWLLSALALAVPCLDTFTRTAGASTIGSTAVAIVEVLAYIVLLGGTLFTIGRLRAGSEEAPARAGVAVLSLAAWIALLVALGALLFGYVGLSRFIVRTMTWAAVVSGTLYLLLAATDDVATTVFSSKSRFGETLHRGVGIRPAAIDQFGVLLSGGIRLTLVLLALATMLDPFGTSIGTLFGRLGAINQGITVGALSLSPWSLLRSILVFVIGLALVKLFGRWLNGRYLPTTELDGSARNSVSLVARYVGLSLAVLWALASLGIGVERIALLLSALSVGIGFGLQAITQNFVSGLILLAERPVKIGDLVRIGTDEGDVKRISVRSTEIELADHSTLIVPNSELITKSVLNKTLASPLGRIQLQFAVPITADANRVREILLELFATNADVLAEPAPAVFIDGIADNRVAFNAFAHVASPRAAYGARSAILFALLHRLGEEKIDIGTVPQRLELAGPVALPLPAGQTATPPVPTSKG